MAGSKPGERRGGRKKGVPNKANIARLIEGAAVGQLPHQFLLSVMHGECINGHIPTFEQRLDAAAKAAPYYAAKLATVAHTGPEGGAIIVEIKNF